jgi:exopolysaccharide biosynthesis protein
MKIIAFALSLSTIALNPLWVGAVVNNQGTTVILNGNSIPNIPWRVSGQRLEIGDTSLQHQLGLELLSNTNYRQQPLLDNNGQTVQLGASLSRQYRYLDITKLAAANGWRWKASGDRLQLDYTTQVIAVQPSGLGSDRATITVGVNRPVPWRLSQDATSGYLTIYGGSMVALRQTGTGGSANPATPQDPGDDPNITSTSLKVTGTDRQTVIQFPIKLGNRAKAVNQRGGIAIEISPTAMSERRVAWAPGVVWQQKWQVLGSDEFPVSILEIDPKKVGVRPIFGQSGVIGSDSIGTIASRNGAAAGINGGYFNRNTKQPLGAFKSAGQWLSSPILGRGAIGWQEGGAFQMGRLNYSETIGDDRGQKITNTLLNSGYNQGATARYTSAWGASYRPGNNETILTVQQNRVTSVVNGTGADSADIPIPRDGYVLVGRSGSDLANWTVGSRLTLVGRSSGTFDRATHILGAGPWLIQNRQVVLNAKGENFSGSFGTQMASRSAIGLTSQGQLQIMAVHGRAGGKGPTLPELAQIAQQLGWVDAMNLDGGSSTSLVLGGQLVDRSPATAARVNSALGIFITP